MDSGFFLILSIDEIKMFRTTLYFELSQNGSMKFSANSIIIIIIILYARFVTAKSWIKRNHYNLNSPYSTKSKNLTQSKCQKHSWNILHFACPNQYLAISENLVSSNCRRDQRTVWKLMFPFVRFIFSFQINNNGFSYFATLCRFGQA